MAGGGRGGRGRGEVEGADALQILQEDLIPRTMMLFCRVFHQPTLYA